MAEWLAAFALTLLVEVPLAVLVAPAVLPATRGRAALVSASASAITHPLLWFAVMPQLHHWSYLAALAVGEALVVAGEALWFRRLLPAPWRWAWGLSALLNAASAATGLLLVVALAG